MCAEKKYGRDETLAWSREGEPAPSVLAWDGSFETTTLRAGHAQYMAKRRARAMARTEQGSAAHQRAAEEILGMRYIADPAPDRGVYFIRMRAPVWQAVAVKIGWASDVAQRLRDLQCASPWPLDLLAVTSGTRAKELAFHRQFAVDRVRGLKNREWFWPSPMLAIEIAFRANEMPLHQVFVEVSDAPAD